MMARKDSEHQKKSMSRLFCGKAIFKPLNTGRIDERVACVREWAANIFFYTKNGVTVMIDAGCNYERLLLKKGGVFAVHDIFSGPKYGDMRAFVQMPEEMGYELVRRIDTANGKCYVQGRSRLNGHLRLCLAEREEAA